MVTIAICGAVLVVGHHKLAMEAATELEGVCEIGVWTEACSS